MVPVSEEFKRTGRQTGRDKEQEVVREGEGDQEVSDL